MLSRRMLFYKVVSLVDGLLLQHSLPTAHKPHRSGNIDQSTAETPMKLKSPWPPTAFLKDHGRV